jgi:hypothetical protein
MKLFGDHVDINQHVFQKCEDDFKKRVSKDSKAMQEKLKIYTDKDSIVKKVKAKLLDERDPLEVKKEEQAAAEALST